MASERPLLTFRPPRVVARDALSGRAPKIHFPGAERQVTRLEPQFNALMAAFEQGRAELAESAIGTVPEQVLVLETAGTIDQFVKAVQAIRGMEWLVGLDQIEIEPDDDFHRENASDRQKPVSGQLFLIMSDQRAMAELQSMWARYKANSHVRFPRRQSKWRAVFNQLKTIRKWDIEDRLRETGAEEDWRARLNEGSDTISVEIEAWFKNSDVERQQVTRIIEACITEEGGRILQESVIEGIFYHGILCKLPITAVLKLLTRNAKLLRCDQVMFFRPCGQISSPPKLQAEPDGEQDDEIPLEVETWNNSKPPVVAVLDGLPLENHALLKERLVLDDPDGWAAEYPARRREHGTAMASVIVNGDLSIDQPPLDRRIYVRPVMKPDQFFDIERMPLDELHVDLIHRAVTRMFEPAADSSGAAPTVRVINFSIADNYVPFFNFVSPLARLIDWLSWKYKVLFIISAGNQVQNIEIPMAPAVFDDLHPSDRHETVLKFLAQDARNRRILSPAESLNALTVGASHSDFSSPTELGDRVDIVPQTLISPISPSGHGFRRALKPELLMPGGRQLYQKVFDEGQSTILELASVKAHPPGIKHAAPVSRTSGANTVYSCGTSYAAALATRTAAQLYEMLDVLRQTLDDGEEFDDAQVASILKALLVHGADWGSAADFFDSILSISGPMQFRRQALRREVSRLVGYGAVSPAKLFDCEDDRATLIGWGYLHAEEAHRYTLPLPNSLAGTDVLRRFCATVAWLSPVNFRHQRYRRAQLWVEPDVDIIDVSRTQADYRAARRGTVQHEVFEGSEVVSFRDQELHIRVNCRPDGGALEEPIPYGLVVSLSADSIPIYQQVRNALVVKAPIAVRS